MTHLSLSNIYSYISGYFRVILSNYGKGPAFPIFNSLHTETLLKYLYKLVITFKLVKTSRKMKFKRYYSSKIQTIGLNVSSSKKNITLSNSQKISKYFHPISILTS